MPFSNILTIHVESLRDWKDVASKNLNRQGNRLMLYQFKPGQLVPYCKILTVFAELQNCPIAELISRWSALNPYPHRCLLPIVNFQLP